MADSREAAGEAQRAITARGYILVVEDHDLNRKLAMEILRLGGYRCQAARNGEDGVAMAERERFDLILMDIQLPGMDGLESTRRIKRSPLSAGVPVVAVSALAHPEDRARALEAGCVGYLEKPYGVRGLLRAVETYLKGWGEPLR